MNKIIVYTDGSCYYKSRLGGVGVYIIDGDKKYTYSKGYSNTTISRCELRALLYALSFIKNKFRLVIVYSDSEYVVNSIQNRWIEKWESESWFDRKNADILQEILIEIRKFKIRPFLKHVKGHQFTAYQIKKNMDTIDKHVFGNYLVDFLCDYKQFKNYEEDK